jgi:hypothetical protein
MVALASAFLGDDTELADRLAALSHGEVVALALELADRSAWARQAIWLSLDARDLDESPEPSEAAARYCRRRQCGGRLAWGLVAIS